MSTHDSEVYCKQPVNRRVHTKLRKWFFLSAGRVEEAREEAQTPVTTSGNYSLATGDARPTRNVVQTRQEAIFPHGQNHGVAFLPLWLAHRVRKQKD